MKLTTLNKVLILNNKFLLNYKNTYIKLQFLSYSLMVNNNDMSKIKIPYMKGSKSQGPDHYSRILKE